MGSPLEQLLQQVSTLALQLQRERRNLGERNRTGARPSLLPLEQQLAQLWNAIRKERSSGGDETEAVSRRSKWS